MFGQRRRLARKRAGLSLRALAERMDPKVTAHAISKWFSAASCAKRSEVRDPALHGDASSARLTALGSCAMMRRRVAAGPLTRRVPCSHFR